MNKFGKALIISLSLAGSAVIAPVVASAGVGDGYHRWDGGAYVWVPGRWMGERHGYHWVPDRWEQRGDHWHHWHGHWER